MATARKPRVTLASGDEFESEQELPVAVIQQDDEQPQESVDRIATLLDIAGNDAGTTLRVFKIQGGESQFCKTYSPHEFENGNFDMLRDHWGPGKFRLMLYGNNPTGKLVIRQRVDITLIAPTGQIKPTNNGAGANDTALAALIEGQQAITQALMNRTPEDPMARMKEMMSMMVLMREAMGLDKTAPKSSIAEIVDAIKELKGAGDMINGGDKEPESLIGMGSKLIEAIGPMMAQRGQQAAQGTMQMPQVSLPPSMQVEASTEPASQPNHTPEQPLSEEEEMNLLALAAVQGNLAKLTMLAKTNAPIEAGAELVAADLPDEFITILKDDANWWGMLTQFAPKLIPHKAWLDQVRTMALEYIAEDEAEQAATQSAAAEPAATPSAAP